MTDTTAQHIAARNDQDLIVRFVAAAEQANIPNADQFVVQNLGRLVSVDIGSGTTVTSVHAYATAVYEQAIADIPALPPKPGENPAAVTDAQLLQALDAVRSE